MSLSGWLALLRKIHMSKSTPIEDPRARGLLIVERLREVMEITDPVHGDTKLPATENAAKLNTKRVEAAQRVLKPTPCRIRRMQALTGALIFDKMKQGRDTTATA